MLNVRVKSKNTQMAEIEVEVGNEVKTIGICVTPTGFTYDDIAEWDISEEEYEELEELIDKVGDGLRSGSTLNVSWE